MAVSACSTLCRPKSFFLGWNTSILVPHVWTNPRPQLIVETRMNMLTVSCVIQWWVIFAHASGHFQLAASSGELPLVVSFISITNIVAMTHWSLTTKAMLQLVSHYQFIHMIEIDYYWRAHSASAIIIHQLMNRQLYIHQLSLFVNHPYPSLIISKRHKVTIVTSTQTSIRSPRLTSEATILTRDWCRPCCPAGVRRAGSRDGRARVRLRRWERLVVRACSVTNVGWTLDEQWVKVGHRNG